MNSSSEQSTASVLSSNLSVLLTLRSVVSPSSDHACIHKCKSDKKCRKSPLSLLPSQLLEKRPLIRCGLEAAGFADTFCSAVLMLLNLSILLLAVSFISVRNCCITSSITCLNCRWNTTISAVVTMSVHNYAAPAAAVFRRLSSASTRDVA